jgi:N-acetylglucosamine-6-phosphate deacetylase
MIAIQACRVISPDGPIQAGVILIQDGSIVAVGPNDRVEIPSNAQLIDAAHLTVTPGLIDIHTHGANGRQAIDEDPDALVKMASFYARHGVTGFLATIGGSNDHIEQGIDNVVGAARSNSTPPGAQVLGIHLEGPFINPTMPGAFRRETIIPPDKKLLERYLQRSEGLIRLLTLAPEVEGADELIQVAKSRDVVCAVGHSAATWEQMMRAADMGLRHIAHTFNALAPFHHRNPGVLGAVLTDDRFTAEVIADGVHVHPVAFRLLHKAKGSERTVLITDSIGAAGLSEGEYLFEEQRITVRNGGARLRDGTLAGSILTMDAGIKNLMRFGGISLEEAVIMGSQTPARVLGLEGRKGSILSGKEADLIALDDEVNIIWTMVGGRVVYSRPGSI